MAPYSGQYPFRTKSLLLIAVISLLARMTCSDSSSSSELPTSQLISKANSLLATGQASKALELYELVLERDPDDYLTLYKKATTQMSLGQNHHASQSLQKVLSLKDFDKAQIQLAKIHLKSGDYDSCQTELDSFRKNHDKSNPELSSLDADLKSAQKHLKNAHADIKSKKYSKCVDEASAAIKISPQSPTLRQLRADCHLMQGHVQEAAGDLT
jgi:DnaJ family protein C protein 3